MLREKLLAMLGPARRLVIDMSAVSYADATTGIAVLVATDRRATLQLACVAAGPASMVGCSFALV
jgi:anti-anti-sigma regulatory factor